MKSVRSSFEFAGASFSSTSKTTPSRSTSKRSRTLECHRVRSQCDWQDCRALYVLKKRSVQLHCFDYIISASLHHCLVLI